MWKAWLQQGLSPKRLAFTLAVGVLCAFFPILGLATPLCVLAGWRFRLNHPMLQAINASTSIAYVPVVYGLVRLGDRVLGPAGSHVPAIAGHALLGWALAAPVWLAVSFPVAYAVLRRRAPAISRPATAAKPARLVARDAASGVA